jgi:cytochrome c oxidase accessory protein FixG
LVQSALLTTIMLVPFLSITGNPALRMDIVQRTFFLAGVAIRIDQFYLVLLSTLVVGAWFLLLTVILGRVWCGWICPQTVVNDLQEMVVDFLRPMLPQRMEMIGSHVAAGLISVVLSINLLCWFMSPAQTIQSLLDFPAHPALAVVFLLSTLAMYLNLLLVQRSFCHSYCPYGRFQAALLDEGTLNLAFLEETRHNCINCKACVRICPMGIDIRQGFQIECINCGRCIDACCGVMQRRNADAGLIAYRFGEIVGSGPRIGSKTAILTLLVCVLSAVLAWGLYARSESAFSVQRIATAEAKTLPDGSQVHAWRAIIGNRGQTHTSFALEITPRAGEKVELLGPVSAIPVAPNENRQVSFFIRFNGSDAVPHPVGLRLMRNGVAVSTIQVTP